MDIFEEWHPHRNQTPEPNVSRGSGKRVWWLGRCGHEWEAIVQSRTRGAGCPFCSNQRVLAGFNDLETQHPALALEWHPHKNPAGPDSVVSGSKKRAWWLCSECAREWQTRVDYRALQGTGCPSCRGRVRGIERSGPVPTDLAAEWSPRNDKSPGFYSVMSNSEVWWTCRSGHEWRAPVARRASGSGCPVCAGVRVDTGVNDLATVAPDIASEWHPTLNVKDLSVVSAGSGLRAWWVCETGHEWQSSVCSRVSYGTGCPVCSGTVASPGVNDLGTTHPDLVKEWHPSKNENTPDVYTSGSGYRAWWVCPKGHEWQTQICNRTGQGTGCLWCVLTTARPKRSSGGPSSSGRWVSR